ncbi:MAG: hypothetical protein ABI467_26735 [Kofleriaceae bacterium]
MEALIVAGALAGALVIALAGCGASDLPCRLPAGTDVLECMELDVTSPVAFDHVDVFAATHSLAADAAIATPAIEAGATLPDLFLVYARSATSANDLGSTTAWHVELDASEGWQKEVAIAATANGAVVAVGGIRLNLRSSITDGLEDIWYGGTVTLAPPPANVEVWGSTGDVACARLALDQAFYFTREGDLDCDGIADDVDPDPLRFQAH